MKSALIAALLVGTAIASKAPNAADLHSYSFEDYVAAFDKSYSSKAERELREATFNENLNAIRAHNANPSKSYTMNVNHMADWTVAERRRLNGGIPKAKHGLKAEHLPNMKVAAPAASNVALPRSVDWRRAFPPVVTAVKNQGQCGSCWAHGSTETLESHYAIHTGELFVLSQEQVTACAPNPNHCGGTGGCQGSTAELAYEYVIQNGGITETWQWGYASFNGTTGVCGAPPGTQSVASFGSYVVVNSNDVTSVMTAVAQNGPLAVNVDASAWSFYESGVFDGCSYSANIDIDHVVQLVGYGHDDGLNKDYWLIRNSWSASYGEGGYIRLLRENTTVCGTDSSPADGTGCNNGPSSVKVCGMCGVLYDTSYPVPNVPTKKQVKLH